MTTIHNRDRLSETNIHSVPVRLQKFWLTKYIAHKLSVCQRRRLQGLYLKLTGQLKLNELGTTITNTLKWDNNITQLVKKGQQRLPVLPPAAERTTGQPPHHGAVLQGYH